jgi:hypothetical protein
MVGDCKETFKLHNTPWIPDLGQWHAGTSPTWSE